MNTAAMGTTIFFGIPSINNDSDLVGVTTQELSDRIILSVKQTIQQPGEDRKISANIDGWWTKQMKSVSQMLYSMNVPLLCALI